MYSIKLQPGAMAAGGCLVSFWLARWWVSAGSSAGTLRFGLLLASVSRASALPCFQRLREDPL